MKQITLDDSLLGYACRCGKIFDTMSKIKKHHKKAYIKRRNNQDMNLVLENFGFKIIKLDENSFNQNLHHLRVVS